MKNTFFQPNRYNGYGGLHSRKVVAPKVSERISGKNFAASAYMADIIDLPSCATPDTEFNTGIPLCDLKKKKLIGVIFADRGVYFTPAHRASASAFLAEVEAKTLAPRGSRVYPLWDIRNLDDQTGEPSLGALGNLTTSQAVTADGTPAFVFGYNGAELQHAILAKIEAGNYDVFLVDEAYVVYGTRNGDNLVGFSTEQIYVFPSKYPVSDFVNQYAFRITMASMQEYKSQTAFVVTNSGLIAKVGLINVKLSEFSQVSNVIKLYMIAAGGTNIEPLYGAILDGLTWTAVNLETGASFPITSVATDATNDVMTFTMDSTAWTALSVGDRVQISGPLASAMAAANVKPFEIVPFIVTKAA